MIKVFVHPPYFPDTGPLEVTLPIPDSKYKQCISELQRNNMGDEVEYDCFLDKIETDSTVLQQLVGSCVNIEELDYLAQRIESFDLDEHARFQACAHVLTEVTMKDLINLTFCCNDATVVYDFSDLESIGTEHYMTTHGGCISMEESEKLNGTQVALDLFQNETAQITPFGVLYDNGLKLSQIYDGFHFPCFAYNPPLLIMQFELFSYEEGPSTIVDIPLPCPDLKFDRMLSRNGVDLAAYYNVSIINERLPSEINDSFSVTPQNIKWVNRMCQSVTELNKSDMSKLIAAIEFTEADTPSAIYSLANQLDYFDYFPHCHNTEDYGRYMIQESEHFEYDSNLEGFYDYEKYGQSRIAHESGMFCKEGYIAYHGPMCFEELLIQSDFGDSGTEEPHSMFNYEMKGI